MTTWQLQSAPPRSKMVGRVDHNDRGWMWILSARRRGILCHAASTGERTLVRPPLADTRWRVLRGGTGQAAQAGPLDHHLLPGLPTRPGEE